jgi:Fe-S cluster assembly scaffold protein SufB
MSETQLIEQLYASLGERCATATDIAHVEIHGNRVLGVHLVPGFEIEADEKEDGIAASVRVRRGAQISQPVRICFGLLPEQGVQRIQMKIDLEEDSRIAVMASCTFPNAVDVLHTMDAEITARAGSQYAYLERHVHGREGGVNVVPRAKVVLEEGARFRTDFELIRGRVGTIDIDYDAVCHAWSSLEMSARISGRGSDRIRIHEKAHLIGEHARGVLTTNIAVRDGAAAEIFNTLIASAAYARGHVDCKEIVKGDASAQATPIVEVRHEKAHVTHEAAIGSVDGKQLETLMSRGLSEDQATELIIEGLLSPAA